MLKLKSQFLFYYKNNVCYYNNHVLRKNKKIITPLLNDTHWVYNGSLVLLRKFNPFFISRSIKCNTLFKKPLKRPSKK